MAAIPSLLQAIIAGQEHTRFHRVHFTEFGDAGLKFEAVYYVLSPNQQLSMDIQQAINLEILSQFERRGIELAQPGRGLLIDRGPVPVR